jgi:single-strand DNA-binding protein
MRNFNLAVLEGRLVSDPEIRYTQDGMALCVFAIANNHSYYKENELQKEVSFFEVTTWGKLAELCNEYLKKGRRVIVNGRIKQSKWLDKDGAARTRTSIVGNQVQFLDFKEAGETEAGNAEESAMEAEKEPAEVLF